MAGSRRCGVQILGPAVDPQRFPTGTTAPTTLFPAAPLPALRAGPFPNHAPLRRSAPAPMLRAEPGCWPGLGPRAPGRPRPRQLASSQLEPEPQACSAGPEDRSGAARRRLRLRRPARRRRNRRSCNRPPRSGGGSCAPTNSLFTSRTSILVV